MHWGDFSNRGNGEGKRKAKNSKQPPNVNIFNGFRSEVEKFDFGTNVLFLFHSALERKISLRANRDVLVQKGILLPESPVILGTFYPRYLSCELGRQFAK